MPESEMAGQPDAVAWQSPGVCKPQLQGPVLSQYLYVMTNSFSGTFLDKWAFAGKNHFVEMLLTSASACPWGMELSMCPTRLEIDL